MKIFIHIKPSLRFIKNQIIALSKRIVLPGFEGIPLYEVISFFVKGLRRSSLISRANALSFSILLSIFPGILFLFTLIPYIPIEDLQETIMNTIENAIPYHTYKTVEKTIYGIISHHHGGLLSFGFFVSIYFSTNAMMGMMKAFNRTSHTIETRSNFKLRLISFLLIVIVTIIIIISSALLISSDLFLTSMQNHEIIGTDFAKFLINAGKWIITLFMIFIAISTIYYMAPASRKHFRFISAGSTLATLLSFLFVLGFNFYIDHFAQYNKLYGSIGTLIVLMLWINLNAIVLLIGFELNASIVVASRRKGKTLKSDN